MKTHKFFSLDLSPSEAVACVTLVQIGVIVFHDLNSREKMDSATAQIFAEAMNRLEDVDKSVFDRLRDKLEEALEYANIGTIY